MMRWIGWNYLAGMLEDAAVHVRAQSWQLKAIHAIPRGGLVPGAYLSHALRLPLVDATDARELSEKCLVVDDNTITGSTLRDFSEYGCRTLVLVEGADCPVRADIAIERSRAWPVFAWECTRDAGVRLAEESRCG